MVRRLGDRLAKEGYRGFFEVDFLVDRDTGGIYLGELNPRVSGLSPITHVTLGAYADAPLFLFHLLEYLDVDYEIDVDEINARWARLGADDVWSQLIVKETADGVELLTATPQTGSTGSRASGWCACGPPTTGTTCSARTRSSTCACRRPATTGTRAPTWA